MATLNKLQLMGVRSFEQRPEDDMRKLNLIKFHRPLTLIVGKNGCGKTVRSSVCILFYFIADSNRIAQICYNWRASIRWLGGIHTRSNGLSSLIFHSFILQLR